MLIAPQPKNNFSRPGFSLIEVVVILFIVSMGLIGVLNLAIDSSRMQTQSGHLLIAQQLATEGLELIINRLDNNLDRLSAPADWNQGIEGSPEGLNYRVDWLNPVTPVNDISETRLKWRGQDPHQYYGYDGYGFASSDPYSPFSRMITIIQAAGAPSSTVKSLVEWTDNGQTYSYELQTEIYYSPSAWWPVAEFQANQ